MGVREASAMYRVAGEVGPTDHGVPAGFKRTEVGVIPQDWNVTPLGDLGKFRKGRGVRRDEALSGDLPCVRYGELYTHHNDIVRRFNSYISQSVASTSTPINRGDILFAGSGETKEEIGKSVAFLGPEPAYAGGDIVILSLRSGDPAFLGYALNASYVVRQKAAKGQGDAVVHVTSSGLTNITVALPVSVAEQEAIAVALSDADALIDALRQLIAKKRVLKQGAMQALMTGRQRLPGFSGEWKSKPLSELFFFSGGFSASRAQLGQDGHLYLHYGDIHGASSSRLDVGAGVSRIPRLEIPLTRVSCDSMLEDGDVVFVDASEDEEGVSKHVVVSNPDGIPFIAGLHTIVARRTGRELEHAYCRYCFHLEDVKQQFRFFAVGTKVQGVSKGNIGKIELRFPPSDEQTAIATVLSDMDAELDALEARLAKTRDLKAGMMQALLTGRIRLPLDQAA